MRAAILTILAACLQVPLCSSANTPSDAPFVQQGPKLIGTGAVGGVGQGVAVAVSADGGTLAVGGVGDNNLMGATWVYTRSGMTWSQQGGKLVGSGADGAAYQGCSVSLSSDGSTLAVGGFNDGNHRGAVWVFTRERGAWTQQGEKLVGSGADTGAPGTAAFANQGWSVSLSQDGKTLAVGAPLDSDGIGATWVFVLSGNVWTQQGPKLVGTGGGGGQGGSVSLDADGSTLAVGGWNDVPSGATWVFSRLGDSWTQQGDKIVATGADAGEMHQGYSVALSGDGSTMVVGDTIGVWVFERSNGAWAQTGGRLVGTGGVAGSPQGLSVSMSGNGNYLASGTGAGDLENNLLGGTWVFARSNAGWVQLGDLLLGDMDGYQAAKQGASVSLSADGGTLGIGGPQFGDYSGAAWVFVCKDCPRGVNIGNGSVGQENASSAISPLTALSSLRIALAMLISALLACF